MVSPLVFQPKTNTNSISSLKSSVATISNSKLSLASNVSNNVTIFSSNASYSLFGFSPSEFSGGNDIIQTSDNNLVIAGDIQDSLGSPVTRAIKISEKGKIIWEKSYGEGYLDSVIETNNGNLVFSGEHNSTSYLLKVDQNGNMLWNKSYGIPSTTYYVNGSEMQSTQDFVSYQVKQLENGDFILVGSKDQTVTSNYPDTFLSNNSDWVVMTDPSGTMLWNKSFYDTGFSPIGAFVSELMDVIETPDHDLVFVGSRLDISHNNVYPLWLVKTDSQGNILFNNTYAIPNSYSVNTPSIVLASDGSYIVSGTDVVHGNSFETHDYMILMKISSSGQEKWLRIDKIDDPAYSSDVFANANGGYNIIGSTNLYSDNKSNQDIFMEITDKDGFEISRCFFGTQNYEFGSAGVQLKDGTIAVTGGTRIDANPTLTVKYGGKFFSWTSSDILLLTTSNQACIKNNLDLKLPVTAPSLNGSIILFSLLIIAFFYTRIKKKS